MKVPRLRLEPILVLFAILLSQSAISTESHFRAAGIEELTAIENGKYADLSKEQEAIGTLEIDTVVKQNCIVTDSSNVQNAQNSSLNLPVKQQAGIHDQQQLPVFGRFSLIFTKTLRAVAHVIVSSFLGNSQNLQPETSYSRKRKYIALNNSGPAQYHEFKLQHILHTGASDYPEYFLKLDLDDRIRAKLVQDVEDSQAFLSISASSAQRAQKRFAFQDRANIEAYRTLARAVEIKKYFSQTQQNVITTDLDPKSKQKSFSIGRKTSPIHEAESIGFTEPTLPERLPGTLPEEVFFGDGEAIRCLQEQNIPGGSPDGMACDKTAFVLSPDDPSALINDLLWVDDIMKTPHLGDPKTLLALARMSYNAYLKGPADENWENLGPSWDRSPPWGFGWEDSGLRGHVFTDQSQSLVVIAFKGTSISGIIDRGTRDQDKINDNLLFSCCCARVSWVWPTVCDCYMKSDTCNQSCLEREVRDKDRYYEAGLDIFFQVRMMYPKAQIWVTGHSLGAAVSAFLGLSFGLPSVGFQAPGDRLPAERLYLPQLPNYAPEMFSIWQFGHTADPIFTGSCNGPTSLCWAASYALETQCHNGITCSWDTVQDLGWRVSLHHHRIADVITKILEIYEKPPTCLADIDCRDCKDWTFVRDKK